MLRLVLAGLGQSLPTYPSTRYSFIEPFEYGVKFEDGFLLILKNIKYPFNNEITRSQLIAITPHTWPIILSMLSWMVCLIYKSCGEEVEDTEILFYNFICDGYLKFMEGNEDDTEIESEFERKVSVLYKESFDEIENLRTELEEIENKTKNVRVNFKEVEEMKNKKKEILDDMENLIQQRTQLDEKMKKYLASIDKTKAEIATLEEQAEELKKEHKNLKEQIEDQKINPEDVKVMNAEKIELYKELERIKPEKEELFKTLNKQEQGIWTKVDEFEKLNFDFKTLVKDVKIKVIKDQNVAEDVEIEGDIDSIQLSLEDSIERKRDELFYLHELKNKLEEKKSENETVLSEYEEKLKYINDKLFRTGKLYIEKKEISEIEQRKSQKEMDKIENELLKLNLESNSSLLLSEQNLQRAKIMLDRVMSGINCEKEEIAKIISGFHQKIESQHNSMKIYYNDLEKMVCE